MMHYHAVNSTNVPKIDQSYVPKLEVECVIICLNGYVWYMLSYVLIIIGKSGSVIIEDNHLLWWIVKEVGSIKNLSKIWNMMTLDQENVYVILGCTNTL